MTLIDRPMRQVRTLLWMLAVVAVPTLATLSTVRMPVAELGATDNPTPYGYTVSLLLFIVPVVAIAFWHLRYGNRADKLAFLWCAVLMAGLGTMLDFSFGYHFFSFPNAAATLGLRVPAWNWGEMRWMGGYLPIEEFGFYIFGSLFMISVYLWADQNWLSLYDPDAYYRAARAHPRVIRFSPTALGLWVVVVSAGILYRYLHDGGFPGYYVFLMGVGLLPSLLLVRTVKDFVNWQALGFAFGGLVLVSVIWEPSIALPYGWWAYKSDQMLGIYLHGWANLPVEEISLWLVGVWDAVMFYELFRIVMRKEGKIRHRLFGAPPA
jgi:hypothetical protein